MPNGPKNERAKMERDIRSELTPRLRAEFEQEVQPRLYKWGAISAFVGAVVLWGVLFWGFGWMSAGAVNDQVDAALKPIATLYLPSICEAQARADPDMATKLKVVTDKTSVFRKRWEFEKTGWGTIAKVALSPDNMDSLVDECLGRLTAPVGTMDAANAG